MQTENSNKLKPQSPHSLVSMKNPCTLENQWIVGFTDGEGCFSVTISPCKTMKTKYQVLPEFVVVQHQRDKHILLLLKEKFGCGVVRQNHGDRLCYRVRSLKDLETIIRPFFTQNPLKTKKSQDFKYFCEILDLMKLKKHLTLLGIEEIRKILYSMNNRAKMIKKEEVLGF